MPTYDEELIRVSLRLLSRRAGQRGRLPGARIRRSISTTYYAIFHFLIEEAGRSLAGTHNDLRRRRRTLARTFSHAGVKTAMEKVRGAHVDASAADLLRPAGASGGPVASPAFAKSIAAAFFDAQAKRHEADYDLNKPLSELDARLLISRVRRAIRAWRGANTVADKDFKRAMCILMLLRGQLRRE